MGAAVSEQRDSLRDLVNTRLSTADNVSPHMLYKGGEWETFGWRMSGSSTVVCLPAVGLMPTRVYYWPC
jgi:hypothetical protein